MMPETHDWHTYLTLPRNRAHARVVEGWLNSHCATPEGQAWLEKLHAVEQHMRAEGYDYQKVQITTQLSTAQIFDEGHSNSSSFQPRTHFAKNVKDMRVQPVIYLQPNRSHAVITDQATLETIPTFLLDTMLHEGSHATEMEMIAASVLYDKTNAQIGELAALYDSKNPFRKLSAYQKEMRARIGDDRDAYHAEMHILTQRLTECTEIMDTLDYPSEHRAVIAENLALPPEKRRAGNAYLLAIPSSQADWIDENGDCLVNTNEIHTLIRNVNKSDMGQKFIDEAETAIQHVLHVANKRETPASLSPKPVQPLPVPDMRHLVIGSVESVEKGHKPAAPPLATPKEQTPTQGRP